MRLQKNHDPIVPRTPTLYNSLLRLNTKRIKVYAFLAIDLVDELGNVVIEIF